MPLRIRIYDNEVMIDLNGRLISYDNNVVRKSYSGSVLTGGELQIGQLGTVNYLVFKFPEGTFNLNTAEQLATQEPKSNLTKNNSFGFPQTGPFAWGAAVLRDSGVKGSLNVSVPFVGGNWTAKQLATYCSRIKTLAKGIDVGWTDDF